MCRQLGVDWWAMGEGFTWDSEDLTLDQAVAAGAWAHAKALIQAGDHQLVVLDEVTYPINWGWIDVDDVLATIRDRPSHVNVVCTGRNAPEALDRRWPTPSPRWASASTRTSRASGPRRASTTDAHRHVARKRGDRRRVAAGVVVHVRRQQRRRGEPGPAGAEAARAASSASPAGVERRVVELVAAERRAGRAERAGDRGRRRAVAEGEPVGHARRRPAPRRPSARRRASGPATAGRRTRPTSASPPPTRGAHVGEQRLRWRPARRRGPRGSRRRRAGRRCRRAAAASRSGSNGTTSAPPATSASSVSVYSERERRPGGDGDARPAGPAAGSATSADRRRAAPSGPARRRRRGRPGRRRRRPSAVERRARPSSGSSATGHQAEVAVAPGEPVVAAQRAEHRDAERCERLAQHRLVAVGADPVEHHPGDGRPSGRAWRSRGRAAATEPAIADGVDHEHAPARRAGGRRRRSTTASPSAAPSNRPMTPSMTSTSAPAPARAASGPMASAPHSHGSRLRGGRPEARAW